MFCLQCTLKLGPVSFAAFGWIKAVFPLFFRVLLISSVTSTIDTSGKSVISSEYGKLKPWMSQPSHSQRLFYGSGYASDHEPFQAFVSSIHSGTGWSSFDLFKGCHRSCLVIQYEVQYMAFFFFRLNGSNYSMWWTFWYICSWEVFSLWYNDKSPSSCVDYYLDLIKGFFLNVGIIEVLNGHQGHL